MSSAAAVGEIAVGRFMRCYRGKSRACGARRFFLLRAQALRPGLNCDAPPGLRSGAGRARKAGEARRGHGCPVPLQRQDAAFGLGALKRRPYNYGKGRKPVRFGAVPLGCVLMVTLSAGKSKGDL